MPSKTMNDWLAGTLGMPPDLLAKVTVGNAPAAAAKAAAPGGATEISFADEPMVVTATAPGGRLPSPMLPDCKIVHGKVPGPRNHVLCEKHGHVCDTDAKMIIAHSVDEYRKSHPVAAKGAPAHSGKAAAAPAAQAGKAAGAGPSAAAATAAPAASQAPQPAAAPAAANASVSANAAPAAAGAAPAAANAAQAQKLINNMKWEIEEFEADCKVYEDAQGSSRGERAVSWVARKFSSGDDPSDKLEEMRGQLVQEQMVGIAAAGTYNFAEAGKHLDAIKAIVEKARKLIQGASDANVAGAGRVVTGLEVASKAGDFATEGLKVMAPPVGEALAVTKKVGVTAMQVHLGDHVNWAEFTVDIGCELFFDKLGGGKLAKRVGGPLSEKLVAKFGKKVSKEFIDKAVEDVVKSEMQAVAKQTAANVYEVAEGKDMTYEEFLSKIVDKMTDPKELLFTVLSAKIGADLKSSSTPI